MGKYRSLPHRLSHNSRREGDCDVWTGYCQKGTVSVRGEDGAYGRVNLTYEGRSLKFPVHRVAKVLEEMLILDQNFNFYNKGDKKLFFELYFAYSACGLSIDHLCERTLCCNPVHLEWVYLTHNQKRKKWKSFAKRKKILHQTVRVTRHYRSLLSAEKIEVWIKKITAKQYRIT